MSNAGDVRRMAFILRPLDSLLLRLDGLENVIRMVLDHILINRITLLPTLRLASMNTFAIVFPPAALFAIRRASSSLTASRTATCDFSSGHLGIRDGAVDRTVERDFLSCADAPSRLRQHTGFPARLPFKRRAHSPINGGRR